MPCTAPFPRRSQGCQTLQRASGWLKNAVQTGGSGPGMQDGGSATERRRSWQAVWRFQQAEHGKCQAPFVHGSLAFLLAPRNAPAHHLGHVLPFFTRASTISSPPPHHSSPPTTQHTCTTMQVGTLEFMPPELLLGGNPSPAADVYALGILLNQAATRQLPYSDAERDDPLMQTCLELGYSRCPRRNEVFLCQ